MFAGFIAVLANIIGLGPVRDWTRRGCRLCLAFRRSASLLLQLCFMFVRLRVFGRTECDICVAELRNVFSNTEVVVWLEVGLEGRIIEEEGGAC